MDPKSHNLLESCWYDGQDGDVKRFHYNALMAESNHTYRVDFTREVTSSGININVTAINPSPSVSEASDLTNKVNGLQNVPKDGFECEKLGWSYLGHMSNNGAAIEAVVNEATANGNEFVSLFYTNGYFVFGCPATKQFYDKG